MAVVTIMISKNGLQQRFKANITEHYHSAKTSKKKQK